MSSTILKIAGMIGHGIADAVAVFEEDGDRQRIFLMQLGYPSMDPPTQLSLLPASLAPLITALDGLDEKLGDEDAGVASDNDVNTALEQVFVGVGTVVVAVKAVAQTLASQLPDFERRLYGFSLAQALKTGHPILFAVLVLAGVIEDGELVLDNEQGIPIVMRPVLRGISGDRLVTWFRSPKQALAQVYGWGTATIDVGKLFANLQPLLRLRNQWPTVGYPTDKEIAAYALPTDADQTNLPLRLTFPIGQLGPGLVSLSVTPIPIALQATVQDLALTLDVSGQFNQGLQLDDVWALSLVVSADVGTGLGIVLHPGGNPRLVAGVFGDNPSKGIDTTAKLSLIRTAPSPTEADVSQNQEILSIADGSGISAQVVSLSLIASSVGGKEDLSFGAQVQGGALVISAKGGDMFLSKVLPPEGITAAFDAGLVWSAKSGVRFNVSGGLEVTLPLHVSIAGVSIDSLKLKIDVDNGLDVSFKTNVGFVLGPVAGLISDIGAHVDLSLMSGNLGFFTASAGFVPPTGVGIAINSGPVSGGGFLSFKDGRYSGALELKIYEISVKAFGIIDTKMPDGSSGYSFVILISAEFTPIQLGLGFTLNGVGGIIGIHRSLDAEALGNLVRSGSADHLLFPRDLANSAALIISDLGKVFPASEGHYVFGPIGKFGWGTPTLVTGDIGVILELPGSKLGILGEVRVTLPKPDKALVKLNMSVGGALDFSAKTFALDAALHDSSAGGFAISGSMAMRLAWGEKPNFALAVGGFHPAYTPPAGFPKLQPLTIVMAKTGVPSVTVSGFLAVTPNTLQIGGSVVVKASKYGIGLDARVGVKAIFIFSPFSFEAKIDASVKVSFHGYGPSVHLSGLLSGPSPWRVKGDVCVSVLWWDACLRFDRTFGGKEEVAIPTLDPWSGRAVEEKEAITIGLKASIEDVRNWSAVPPIGSRSVVTLAEAGPDVKLIDPMGAFAMRQHAVPLATQQPITRFGAAKAEVKDWVGPIRFMLEEVNFVDGVGATLAPLVKTEDLFDNFSAAQFFDMAEKNKLAAPAYEKYQSGYVFAPSTDACETGSSEDLEVKYLTKVIGKVGVAEGSLPLVQLEAAARKSATAQGGARRTGADKYVDGEFKQVVELEELTYVLMDLETGLAVDGYDDPMNRTDALLALDVMLAEDPSQVGQIRVAPIYEVKEAA